MRIIARLSDDGTNTSAAHLCRVCTEVTGMTGAGIMLLHDEVSQSLAAASNEVSVQVEELQFTLGEGPAVDACQQGRPVLEPDLADPETPRWLGFTPPAVEAGVRAVFAFPLLVGAERFGALVLYRDRPGPLQAEQHADSLALAEVAAEAVLLIQANAPPGALASELATQANKRAVVHQAAGMMSAQLEVSIPQALIRLRASAFSSNRRVVDVAADVVGRHMRFDDSNGTCGSP